MADPACYGREFDRRDECAACPERPWCRDAGDPRPLATGTTPGTVAGGSAAFEAAEHEPHPSEEHDHDGATEFSRAVAAIITASVPK